MRQGVCDARASGAHLGHVLVAVVEVRGDGGRGGGCAGQKLETEAAGLGLEPGVDEVAVAVIGLAVGIGPRRRETGQ